MAAFTETVERRNPAMVATGLAVYGMIVRCIIAVSIFFVPHVVTTVTTLVEQGPVAAQLAERYQAELAAARTADIPPDALATLTEVEQAAQDSPAQWRTYFWIAVGGQVLFIPLIFFMAGFWDPRKARRNEQEHEAWLAAELAKLTP